MTETLTPQRQDVPTDPEPDEPRKVTVADVLERAAYGYEEGLYEWHQGGLTHMEPAAFADGTLELIGAARTKEEA